MSEVPCGDPGKSLSQTNAIKPSMPSTEILMIAVSVPRLAGSPRLDGSFGRSVWHIFCCHHETWTATTGNYRDEAAVRDGFIANRVTMLQMAAI